MTLSSVDALRPVLAHAEAERDAALAAVRAAEQAAARSQAQADQLQEYRGEFRDRWRTRFASEGTTTLLQCRHGFGQRLDQDLEQTEVGGFVIAIELDQTAIRLDGGQVIEFADRPFGDDSD